jgi:2-polyprenyl-6-methoxyphenol hydroxylase-like FAD-dependent oxidoreductase
MQESFKTQVLVAGAGPVGLAMAAELARYGVPVRVVDKAPRRTDKSKALVVWSRTLELMDHMGCTPEFLDAGLKVTDVSIYADQNQIGHMSLAGVPSPHPFALMIPQSETERLLEAHLGTLGVKVERSVELVRFDARADRVVSTLRRADGTEETVESAWLVGCDGAHSTVRHGLGVVFQGDTLESDWILADVHLQGVRHPGHVEVDWHTDGIVGLFPIRGDRYRVIADAGTHPEAPTLEEVQAILERRGAPGLVATDPVWLAAFRINERKVADYRVGRVFLAGDAAHIHSPAGGQGMNTGIQDACNLAWKLALVCRGVCPAEPLLGSYSPERSGVGDMVLKETGRMTALATMRGGIEQFVRNHIASVVFGISPVVKKIADGITELSIGYPDSPLNAQGAHVKDPAVGERAPISEVQAPVGAGRSPLLVAFGDDGTDFSALAAQYPALLDPVLCKPFHEAGLWLVRPDGYVLLATKAGNWPAVGEALRRLAGA